ncbi:MAG: hypothetical protein JNK75_10190 [Betaproteobacteria bacterium]|nr:hypothetical protein [Betaproteobacteria bacterium]
MIQWLKTSFVNVSGVVAAFLICWSVFSVFDPNTARAGVLSACVALGTLAAGLFMWSYDSDYLDTLKLLSLLTAILLILAALMVWELAVTYHKVWSAAGVAAHLKSITGSWRRLLAFLVFLIFVPFLTASVVRSTLIAIMVNAFAARKFGLASKEEIAEREARKSTPGVFFVGSEFGAIVMLALFWPGIWALMQIHDGHQTKGAVSILVWIGLISGLFTWLHRKQWVSLWVSGSALVATMLAAGWIIWSR